VPLERVFIFILTVKNTINIEMLIKKIGRIDDNLDYLDTQDYCWSNSTRNRDLSALFVVFYALNIIDANVDAALLQFNVDENISFKPSLYTNDVTLKANVGLTINYNF
jgi:hypothetical protein